MDALTIILLVLLGFALIGACTGKWGNAPMICTVVAVLLIVIQRFIK